MRMVKAVSCLLLSLIISACSTVKEPGTIKTILLYPPIPYELLSCAAEPTPVEIETQEDFAIWAESVRLAGKDCRNNLSGLRAFISSWEADIDMMDPWWAEGDDY